MFELKGAAPGDGAAPAKRLTRSSGRRTRGTRPTAGRVVADLPALQQADDPDAERGVLSMRSSAKMATTMSSMPSGMVDRRRQHGRETSSRSVPC